MTIPDVTIGPFGWTAICVGSLLILAVIAAPRIGRYLNAKPYEDAGRPRSLADAPEVVNWLPFLPPVPLPTTPPLTQSVPSPDWFYDVPVDVLSDDAVRVLCDDIERRWAS